MDSEVEIFINSQEVHDKNVIELAAIINEHRRMLREDYDRSDTEAVSVVQEDSGTYNADML